MQKNKTKIKRGENTADPALKTPQYKGTPHIRMIFLCPFKVIVISKYPPNKVLSIRHNLSWSLGYLYNRVPLYIEKLKNRK